MRPLKGLVRPPMLSLDWGSREIEKNTSTDSLASDASNSDFLPESKIKLQRLRLQNLQAFLNRRNLPRTQDERSLCPSEARQNGPCHFEA